MNRTLYNFIRGYGSVIDLIPAPGRPAAAGRRPARSDADAMWSDWAAIGGDFRSAIGDVVPGEIQHVQAEEPEPARDRDAARCGPPAVAR